MAFCIHDAAWVTTEVVYFGQIDFLLLSFFRLNDPYRLIGLLLLFLLLSFPVFISSPGLTLPELLSFIIGEKIHDGLAPYSQLVDSTPPLTQWMYGLVDFITGRSLIARHIIAFLVLFFQAVYLSITFINRKAFAENTYVPSFLFILLCTVSFDILSLSGSLLASGFLLLAINSLFKEIEFREQRDENLLRLAIYLSLASLADFVYIVFFAGTFVILILFTRTTPRRQLLFVFGFLLPHLILASVYYYTDNLNALWQFYYLPNILPASMYLLSYRAIAILFSIPIIYFVISFFILNRAARLTNYQSQLLQSMIVWLSLGVVLLFFTPVLQPQALLPLFPPLSFLLAHFLLAIRRKRIAEFHTWAIVLGIVCVSTMGRLGYFTSVSYDKLLVKPPQQTSASQSLLTLSDNISVYAANHPATGFINWQLAQSVFEQPEYYENILFVRQQLTNDPPQIIEDPQHRLRPFLSTIPELQAMYVFQNGYYRKK
jgi:hypothetical protein